MVSLRLSVHLPFPPASQNCVLSLHRRWCHAHCCPLHPVPPTTYGLLLLLPLTPSHLHQHRLTGVEHHQEGIGLASPTKWPLLSYTVNCLAFSLSFRKNWFCLFLALWEHRHTFSFLTVMRVDEVCERLLSVCPQALSMDSGLASHQGSTLRSERKAVNVVS